MKLILIFLSSILWQLGFSQALNNQNRAELNKLIQDQLQEKLAPGLAIGIVQNGQIIFESYAGYANLKEKVRLSGESRFNYASSGKQFTALAILKLIEKGKIRLNDDIRKFLPDFYPNIREEIQIQHLLTHSSGIRDVYELWTLKGITWWEETFSNQDAMELLADQQQLSFTPGSTFLYSNSNYILLTEIIKKVTSSSFKDFSDRLFEELKMQGTAFEPDHTDIPRRVLPYGFWKKYRMYEWNTDLIGDGALFTTLPDQLNWEVKVQQMRSTLITDQTMKKSQQPLEESSIQNYGYGLEFDGDKSFHHGSTGAYGATFVRYPNDKLSIVIMTNYTNISTSSIADKCHEIITGSVGKQRVQRTPQKINPFVSVDSLLGTYKTPFGYYYRFVTRSDSLFLERTNRAPVALEHEKGNIYHEIADPDFQLAFTIDPNLGMQITAYYPTHDPYRLTKQEIDWDDYDYTKINGTYHSDELDVSLKVTHLGKDEYQVRDQDKEYQIQIFEPDVLWFRGYKAEIVNDSSPKLLISSSRNRNVLFSKVGQ